MVKQRLCEIEPMVAEKLSFWANPSLLECYARRDNLTVYYILVFHNGNLLGVMPIFEKRKYGFRYVVSPHEYCYTPIDFFLSPELSLFRMQNHRVEIMKAIASFLYKEYVKVMLHLHFDIEDIRAFKWTGYTAIPIYTYIKKLEGYTSDSLPKDTRRQLNSVAKGNGLYVKECWDMEAYTKLVKELLLSLRRSLRQVSEKYIDFLNKLYELGFCTKHVVYREDEPMGCAVVMTDSLRAYAFALVSGISASGRRLSANHLLFDHQFKSLENMDYFDFYGAGVEDIAYFKSQFNCELVPFYRIIKKFRVF